MGGEFAESTRASKRVKLLSEDESSASDSESSGGVKLNGNGLSINQEYARRFEHNSKRAELHRLEEKYGAVKAKRMQDRDRESEDDDDSTSAEEDDDGALASGVLEADFNATLQAIRKKDPRIYKQEEKFYNSDQEETGAKQRSKTEKPMYLSDYHRQNLLNGNANNEGDEPIQSYDQRQNALKDSLVKEMHAVKDESDEEASDEEGMFKVKRRPTPPPVQKTIITTAEVDKADQDPENFLDKFLSSRAWVNRGSNEHAFESDDDEEDERAEAFEEAYNLRFEKADGLNEKLVSHARDTAAKYSVRDEAKSRRQRARDLERDKKEDAKAERTREKALLKKLRMEEMEKKLEKIKEAAGGRDKKLKLEEWSEFLADDWDDEQWEKQMKSKFDEEYYAEADKDFDAGKSSKKVSKPKWDDDIDIGDIIADFEEDDDAQFSLSDEEESSKKRKKIAVEDEKKEARKNKRKLEQLAEEKVNLELIMGQSDRKGNNRFRYRETSPVSWGLSSRDILMATDSQLNTFAGLKKFASFREPEKRRKDKKKLGKKARLAQWRRETFGDVNGPKKTIQDVMREAQVEHGVEYREAEDTANGTGKRKRSKKNKVQE